MSAQISKAEEIKMIQKLGINCTYFGDAFDNEDIKTMCYNIESDFPILMNTKISNEAKENAQDAIAKGEQIKNLTTSLEQEKEASSHYMNKAVELNCKLDTILRALVRIQNEEVNELLSNCFDRKDILAAKIVEHVDLSEREAEIVVSYLK